MSTSRPRPGEPDPVAPGRPPRWPWAAFAAAAAWAVAVRVPLVLNAPAHLDSDLAVDGLTLLDAAAGRWRWHYPGTPFTGIGAVLLSLPQALVWGATPETLASGGVVAYVGLMLATFLLARRAFGTAAAAGSLVPLAFASNGAVWLSGRVTGGHLLAAAWHAGAFALLADGLSRPGWKRASALLGFWCGLGLYLDSMFAVSVVGVAAAAVAAWGLGGWSSRGPVAALVFLGAFLAGVWPRPVGARLDPHDAYRGQFALVSEPDLLAGHARILALQCLPRLLSGHLLPDLRTDPDPATLAGSTSSRRRAEPFDAVAACAFGLTLALAAAAAASVAAACFSGGTRASRAVAVGLLVSSSATLAGFVANRHIYNSDNYRYLVGLLVPWSVGVGLALTALGRKGRPGKLAAVAAAVALAGLMTADLGRWYARFGWVDGRGLPVRKALDDSTAGWLAAHPEVGWIEGGYWDVYRLAFLTGGRVRGAPFPVYPNRFPGWRPSAGGRRAVLVRPTPESAPYYDAAARSGAVVVHRSRGLTVLSRPWPQ